MSPDRMEHMGALALAGMILLGSEIAIVLSAFSSEQVQRVILGSSVVSLVLAMFINLKPVERRGKIGSRTAVIGGMLMLGMAGSLPILGGPAYLAQVVGALFIAALWLLPHMAAQQLMAGGLLVLKSRIS